MKRGLIGLATVAIALAAAMYSTAASSNPAATVAVCIKPNGQLRVVTPTSPCVEPERQDQWTVGGPSEVVAGAGLTGRSEGGIVTLDVEPGLIESANSGRIVAGFDDGPNEIPDRELARIAELPLPAGNYAIFAKFSLSNPFESGFTSVSCRLDAGGDFDRSSTVVEGLNIGEVLENEGTSALTQSLEVVHRFSAPGSVVLSCADFKAVGDGEVLYEDLKLIAIRGSSLSNTFLGG